MADIWSEKDVGFIGPIAFLSDLTVRPTYFAKSVVPKFRIWKSVPAMDINANLHLNDIETGNVEGQGQR